MIDHRADIHPSAVIADDVTIGPWTIIGPNVEIDSGTWVGPHVVINGPTRIGKNNKIYQFSSLGDAPQDITYSGEDTILEIGDNNIIREYCMINRGTIKGGGITRIGNGNFLMAYTHIGHDCMVGSEIVMVNYAALSGHVTLDDYVTVGPYAAVHQFCRIGAYSFIAKATYVTKDVLPYVMIAGPNVSASGLNTVGLKRRGFSSDVIDQLKRAYKLILRRGLTVSQAIEELSVMVPECPEVALFIESLQSATRGIVR